MTMPEVCRNLSNAEWRSGKSVVLRCVLAAYIGGEGGGIMLKIIIITIINFVVC